VIEYLEIYTQTMNRFLSAVFAFTVATSAFAAAPGGVMNLQAKAQNDGSVLITWDAEASGDIAYYRVYYAADSILESGGAYDDFEETEDSKPEYIFTEAIPAEGLYMAVMAVNMDGDESEYFMEEIQILPVENPDAEAPLPPSPEPTPPLPAPEESGSLALLSAESLTPDSVRLTFSASIQVRPKSAATAFRITKAGGEVLAIRTLQGEGNTVTLVTDLQQGGVVYQVQLTDALRTELGVTFDEASKAAFFTGKGEPPPASASSVSSVASSSSAPVEPPLPTTQPPLPPSPAPAPQVPQAPQGIQNITGLRLRVAPGANGTFNVTGEWDLASVSTNAAFLLVGQSFDAGNSFVSPAMVPANATQVNIQSVPAGHFGLLVQVMDEQGTLSSGVFETAWLGKNMPTPAAPAPVQPTPIPTPPVPAPVLPPVSAQLPLGTPPASGLPQSGMGFLAASLALSGMAVGWQRMRMSKKAAV
jgi:hypothetical protein